MAKLNKYDYTFANAYVGSVSGNLMKKKDYMRVFEARDFDAAETMLREYGYGEAKELAEGDIESFIRREQNRLYNLIYKSLPEREMLAMYLFPFDYHNVKVCLKSEILGIVPDKGLLVSTGDMDWMKTVAMVRDRNYDFMPVNMKHGIIEAMDRYSKSRDPQDIDIILDKACYKDMIETAGETGEQFLIDMVKTKIDTINADAFVRLRNIGKNLDFFEYVFIEGGNISYEIFAESYGESYDRIGEKLEPYGFAEIMTKGAADLENSGDFTEFEKMLSDRLMQENKRAKYETFGIMPVAGYWYGKQLEIDNLRIVLTGKLFGFSQEEIEGRLREPYV